MPRLAAHNFKYKLVIALLAVGLMPLIGASILYLNILNRRIVKDSETASLEKLRYLSVSIDRQMETAQQLLGWITYNQRLQEILTRDYDNTYDKQLDIITFASYVTEYSINANMESNILKILIQDEYGDSFQLGNGYSLLRAEDLTEAGWLEYYQKQQADELAQNMDWYMKDTYVFPMSSRIYDSLTGKPVGWCLIVFENTMYSDYLAAGAEDGSGEWMLIINDRAQCIGSMKQEALGTDLSGEPWIREILSLGQAAGYVEYEDEEAAEIIHYYRIPDTDMIAVRGISLDSYLKEKKEMTRLAGLFIVVIITSVSFIVLYLSDKLMEPINVISNYIRQVPENGFKGDLVLKNHDEFQIIAESMNTMEKEILQLMEAQRQEADIKKQLEFQVLQNQINPHFLYNTLNSIKWMATLQHADTIRDMTAALGRLLQNISKGTDSKIPIYEEMSLLDDYVLIQDIRYDGKIRVEYHIGSREITQAYIIKFLLQPIVENAIFHGIEPKDGDGQIDIYLNREGDDITIEIVDDGIGMTGEQSEALLNPETGSKNERGLSGIGISNINERIKITYGCQYGVEIISRPGRFTGVTIRIPYEEKGVKSKPVVGGTAIENNDDY